MEVKEYLEKAYKLETEYLKHYYAKDLLEDEIEELNAQIKIIEQHAEDEINYQFNRYINKKDRYIKESEREPSKPYYRTWDKEEYQKILSNKIYFIIFLAFIWTYYCAEIESIPFAIMTLLLIIPIIKSVKTYKEKVKILDKNFEQEIKKYNQEYKKYEKKLKNIEDGTDKELLDLMKDYEESILPILNEKNQTTNKIKEEITKLRELKKKESTKLTASKKKLKSFYENDILFEKYKNICAISSFLEYYESERTNTLTGQNGAYNIYENELSNKSAMKIFNFDYSNPYSNYQEAQYYLKSIIVKLNKYMNNIRKEMNELTKQS